MSRNSEDTRKRLLKAALQEFAAHGIAGARVDRIADAAHCNKQAIYAYFGSKEGLGDAVMDSLVGEIVESVTIDAYDLPGYAMRLFDRYQSHPETLRLVTWYGLEGKPFPASGMASVQHKIAAIAEAQERGAVSKRYPPDMLMLLIHALTRLGAPGSPEAESGLIPKDAFRQSIGAAVARLANP